METIAADPSVEVARAARPADGAVPRWLLLAISFWGGFEIMVLEVCGFRVLQTNLGSSVLVTGTLLTAVMILLSAGYYLGGQLSRAATNTRLLFSLLAFASVYTGLTAAFLLEPIASLGTLLRGALGHNYYLHTGVPALVLTLLLYGLPVLIMSMISPYWIALQTRGGPARDQGAGVQSGFFMSLSTIGSIAGTMVASYVLVPVVGVETTAIVTSAVFLFLSLAGMINWQQIAARDRVLRVLGALGVAAAYALVLGSTEPEREPGVVYREESLYGEIRVVEEKDSAGRKMLSYHPSRVYTHSVLYPDEPLRDLEGHMYLVPGLIRAPNKILVLGSAVGGVLRSIEVAFPEARVTAVDLDPQVHQVATEVFHVSTAQSRLVAADARVFLSEARELYDLIIVDLFSGEFIPTHCISREFFALVRSRLTSTGGMFVNTNMNDIYYELATDQQPFRPIRHLQATLRAAGFPRLFENSFFHSLLAFRDPIAIGELRARLWEHAGDAAQPAALRAGAGIAAATTAEVPDDRRRYRPFTDRWSPAPLIELKSNAERIYRALKETPPEHAARGRDDEVAAIVLSQRFAALQRSGRPALRDIDGLVRALQRVAGPLPHDALDIAAKHFRFSRDLREVRVEDAGSAWAKLSALYAQLYRLGHRNDYEPLLPVLDALRAHVEAQG